MKMNLAVKGVAPMSDEEFADASERNSWPYHVMVGVNTSGHWYALSHGGDDGWCDLERITEVLAEAGWTPEQGAVRLSCCHPKQVRKSLRQQGIGWLRPIGSHSTVTRSNVLMWHDTYGWCQDYVGSPVCDGEIGRGDRIKVTDTPGK